MKQIFQASIALVALLLSVPAFAGLIGSTVSVTARFGINPDILAAPGNRVVDATVEYAQGSFAPGYTPNLSVDITDDRLIVTNTANFTTNFVLSPFNGFYLTMISGPALVSGIGVAAESDFLPTVVQNNNGEITINFSGVSNVRPGHRSVILLETAGATVIPLPAAGWLLLGGIALMGGVAKRRGH
jgi:hypothetical protein